MIDSDTIIGNCLQEVSSDQLQVFERVELWPEGQMQAGKCFHNAVMAADPDRSLEVVVGHVLLYRHGATIRHAWVVDGGGTAWEITWTKLLPGAEYRGIRLKELPPMTDHNDKVIIPHLDNCTGDGPADVCAPVSEEWELPPMDELMFVVEEQLPESPPTPWCRIRFEAWHLARENEEEDTI